MKPDLQVVFLDLRAMANGTLNLAGQGPAEYPWEAVEQVHREYSKARGGTKKQERLLAALDALRLWEEALENLGNTIIPENVHDLPWYPESLDTLEDDAEPGLDEPIDFTFPDFEKELDKTLTDLDKNLKL